MIEREWEPLTKAGLAGFTAGCLHLFQVAFSQATNQAVPWSRAHQYVDAEAGRGGDRNDPL